MTAHTPSSHPHLNDLDVLIVGAGIFGRVIGRYLERQGRTVTFIDAGKAGAGSKPAACLMKAGWLSKMSKEQQAQSFSVLDECYGIHELEAYVSVPGPIRSLGKRTSIHWVAPGSIFHHKDGHKIHLGAVVEVAHHSGFKSLFRLEIGEPWREANLIILAAGVWCNEIAILGVKSTMVEGLTAQAGAAFIWSCDPDRESRVSIQPYAPYKQMVMLPNIRPGELWVGDGTAVKESSLNEARLTASRYRCAAFASAQAGDARAEIGLRPYVRGLNRPCYLEHIIPGVWVVTGGAKNGTAAAGWAAYKLAEATN